jgi:hypothetical protein
MASVDVYVFMRKVGNDNSFVLHSGQFGPASAVFHALPGALMDGSASGEWSGDHARMRVNGRVLRSMLADIRDLDTADWQGGNKIDATAVRNSITDDAEYVVKAIQY